MDCPTDNAEVNLKRAVARIEKLAKKGAQIICMPELFQTRYFCQKEDKELLGLAEKVPGSTTRLLGYIAKKHKVVIVASLYEEHAGHHFNTVAVIDADGKFLGKYRKMHIPDDLKNYYGEAFYFEKGDLGFKTFKTKYATIGTLVCWDQWFPEAARATAKKGAEIIFYPTSIGYQLVDKYGIAEDEHVAWQTIQNSHAIANNVFIAACNRVGLEDKLNFWGTSFVCDPFGRVLAKAPVDAEADLIVDCDLSLIPQMRNDWPFLDYQKELKKHHKKNVYEV